VGDPIPILRVATNWAQIDNQGVLKIARIRAKRQGGRPCKSHQSPPLQAAFASLSFLKHTASPHRPTT
jgi:hypothetical protein